MSIDKNSLETEKQKYHLSSVIISFFRWFKNSCPKCKVGKLNQDDIHYCWGGGELNVYTCDKCNSKFI